MSSTVDVAGQEPTLKSETVSPICTSRVCGSRMFAGLILLVLGVVTAPAYGQACEPPVSPAWLDPIGWSVLCKAGEEEIIGEAACDDDGQGVAAVSKSELVAASAWLKGLCFRAPVLDTVKEATRVYSAWVTDEETEGDLGQYLPDDKELQVNSSFYFAMGDESEVNMGTMVHELFHAIQANYVSNDAPDWITEGTADAVMLAWLKRTQIGGMTGSTRFFDDPLHRPREEIHAYYTRTFWTWLGDQLAATDQISYLAEMLDEGEFITNDGLDDLESWLEQQDSQLKDLYPAFIADKTNNKQMYSGTARNRSTTISYKEPEAEKKYKGSVEAVAADPVTVKVSVPTGKAAELEISIRPDQEDLHLVVDDQLYADSPMMPSGQAQLKPQLRDPYWKKQRNRFTTTLDGASEPYEFFVRVVNVNEEPADTETKQYTLEIKLKPELGCRFTATIQGDSNKGAASGEIAHFSTKGGTTIAGAFSNPEQMDQMMQMMEAFGSMGGEEAQKENQKALDKMRKEADAWKQEMAAGPRETLGLSLIEMKAGDMTDAEAIGVMTGGFKLQASVFDQPVEPGFSGGLQPGHIIAWPGDWTETVSQQIRYEWKPGAPGSGQINITEFSEDQLRGTINATLYGQGVYKESTGDAPKITVSAQFQAARHDGPLQDGFGCLIP